MRLALPITVELTAHRRAQSEQMESFLDAEEASVPTAITTGDPSKAEGGQYPTYLHDGNESCRRRISFVTILLSVIAFSWVGLSRHVQLPLSRKGTTESENQGKHPHLRNDSNTNVFMTHPPALTCPETIPLSPQNPHQTEHRDDDLSIIKDPSGFFHNFRNRPFDRWAATYNEYKNAMREWKQDLLNAILSQQPARTVDASSKNPREVWVFESASGIGLNLLLMTELWNEFLQKQSWREQQQQLNVTVYGNDYVAESVDLAKMVWSNVSRTSLKTDPVQGHYGTMCRGDSTLLHEWVPANTFDLVYTGYVTPLQDPLQLGLPADELDILYAELCTSKDHDKRVQAQQLQRRQEDWFALWVSEMLRAARPGGVVAVEMISYPTCQDLDEWGGVDPDWWTNEVTLARYQWPVVTESITLQRQTGLPGHRYHVRMQKIVR